MSAGNLHSCALRADGTARCWGHNTNGQLGDGTTTDPPKPVTVSGLSNAVAIAVGGAHACALLADGTVRCWGANADGQLGDKTTTDQPKPVTVSGLTNAVAIAAGGAHACALLAGGTARCWGDNFQGQLGDGTTTDQLTPVAVTTLVGSATTSFPNAVAIAAGFIHTCAVTANGAVFCWGSDVFGQLGNGSVAGNQLRPVAVPAFTLNIDPRVQLKDKTRDAIVNIIATCEEGDRLHVRVTITQGSASGHGDEDFECTGALEKFPVKVHAQGRNTFLPGPAQVAAEADIKDHGLIDHQEWARGVEIVNVP